MDACIYYKVWLLLTATFRPAGTADGSVPALHTPSHMADGAMDTYWVGWFQYKGTPSCATYHPIQCNCPASPTMPDTKCISGTIRNVRRAALSVNKNHVTPGRHEPTMLSRNRLEAVPKSAESVWFPCKAYIGKYFWRYLTQYSRS